MRSHRTCREVAWLLVSLVIICRLTIRARAWGDEGHRIVGAIADIRITSPAARQNIEAILGGQSLSEVATWADMVKKRQPPRGVLPNHPTGNDDPETTAFIQQFHAIIDPQTHHSHGGSASWHFVNLALDAKGYNDPPMSFPMIGNDHEQDVVMMIGQCIKILKGQGPISGAFGKKNALRMLVHLVGDIHQPLHVGSGYIDPQAPNLNRFFIQDVMDIQTRHLASDVGGNILFFSLPNDVQELHAYWDEDLVSNAEFVAANTHHIVAGNTQEQTQQRYATYLATKPINQTWNTVGAESEWSKAWAQDSLLQARRAYIGIRVTDAVKRSFPTHFGHDAEGYGIIIPPTYENDMTPVVEEQLAKAGYHLAALLDRIWPSAP